MMLWSVNYHVATLVVAGVRAMREAGLGYPAELCEPDEVSGWFEGAQGGGWEAWDDILRRIEEGFQAWLDDDWLDHPEKKAKYDEGMALFAKWFPNLWD